MYEQTPSEKRPGKISRTNRKEISSYYGNIIDDQKGKEERKKVSEERYRKVGCNPTIIKEGSRDRILCVAYNDEKYSDETMRNAYREGFFEHGTHELLGIIELLLPENLVAIGYNDYLSGVDFKTLPKRIGTNANYVLGYTRAALEQKLSISK